MRKISVINKDVLDQINLIRVSLEKDVNFDLVKKSRKYAFLKTNADKHSVEIEFPERNKIRKGRAKKIALYNLTLAHNYLIHNCGKKLTGGHIKIAAALINNFQEESILYRTSTARTFCEDGTCWVYPRDVYDQMQDFIRENNSLKNNLEKAIHSHFHIARIHPFDDGNGRLARTLQNSILDCEGLPPIIIKPYEKKVYLKLIGAASKSYRENKKRIRPEQSKFYNYLVLKLKKSLNKIKKQEDRS